MSIHSHYFFGGTESVGSSRIIDNISFLNISIISLVERRAWKTPESLKTHWILYIFIISSVERGAWEAVETSKHKDFCAFPLFLLWRESVGSSKIIENSCISLNFHYFFGGAENVGRSRIIENKWISIHFNYSFGGTESVGSSGIIENNCIFHTFSLILWWRGERGKLQNHWKHRFLYFCIISLVERGAWEALESLKTCGFL